MSRQDDIKKLIVEHNRRLQKLEEQRATYGIDTPPHILLEIENLEMEIERLETKLGKQEDIREITSETDSTDIDLNSQSSESKKGKFFTLQVLWVPLLIALVGLAGVIVLLLVNSSTTSQSFTYMVRVQKEGTSQNIPNTKVTIEVAGQAPLDEITDSNGIARIFIDTSYAGKPSRLLAEARGYEAYTQEIDLIEDNLPDMIPLKSLR